MFLFKSKQVLKKVGNALLLIGSLSDLFFFLAKSGVDPDGVCDLVAFVVKECTNLQFRGLMTIGKYGGDAREDFSALVKCRDTLIEKMDLKKEEVELSMGMSGDFETGVNATNALFLEFIFFIQIKMGSTNVRIGSTIFGQRNYKK